MRTVRHNPFVSVFALLAMALLLVFTVGCDTQATEEPQERFDIECTQSFTGDRRIIVINDSLTDQQFLAYEYYRGVGLACIEQEPTVRYALTENERLTVEQVVMAEAGGEPYCGQVAVAQCILTACEKDGLRPIAAIWEYQYTTDRPEPSESVREAVAAVFDRGEVAFQDNPLYFYAPKYGISEFHEGQRHIGTIGGHRFFGEVQP